MTQTLLRKSTIAFIEGELVALRLNSAFLRELEPLLNKSRVFHLKNDIARARRAATRALAGNEIDYSTWAGINHELDGIFSPCQECRRGTCTRVKLVLD